MPSPQKEERPDLKPGQFPFAAPLVRSRFTLRCPECKYRKRPLIRKKSAPGRVLGAYAAKANCHLPLVWRGGLCNRTRGSRCLGHPTRSEFEGHSKPAVGCSGDGHSCLRRESGLGQCSSPRSGLSCCLHASMAAFDVVLDPCGAGTHFHGDYRISVAKHETCRKSRELVDCIERRVDSTELTENHTKKPIKPTKWPACRPSVGQEIRHGCGAYSTPCL